MTLTNKTYDVLKWVAQIALPAAGTLYFGLAKIWNFPYGKEIVGTISAIDIFLGALLGISSANYRGDGEFQIDASDPEKNIYRLSVNQSFSDLSEKKNIMLKVNKDVKLGSVDLQTQE